MTKKAIFILIGSFVLSGAIFAEGTFVTEDDSKKGKRLKDVRDKIYALEETPNYLLLSKKEQVKIAGKIVKLEEEERRLIEALYSNPQEKNNEDPLDKEIPFHKLGQISTPEGDFSDGLGDTQIIIPREKSNGDGSTVEGLIEDFRRGLPEDSRTSQSEVEAEERATPLRVIKGDDRKRYDRFKTTLVARDGYMVRHFESRQKILKWIEESSGKIPNKKERERNERQLEVQYNPIINHGIIPAIVSLHTVDDNGRLVGKPYCSGAILSNNREKGQYKIVTALHCLKETIFVKVTKSPTASYFYPAVKSSGDLTPNQKIARRGGFKRVDYAPYDWVILNADWRSSGNFKDETQYEILRFSVKKDPYFDIDEVSFILGGHPLDKYHLDKNTHHTERPKPSLYYEECSITLLRGRFFENNCDALPSQSGSPIFRVLNNELHLVGIMTVSVEDDRGFEDVTDKSQCQKKEGVWVAYKFSSEDNRYESKCVNKDSLYNIGTSSSNFHKAINEKKEAQLLHLE